MAAKKTVQVTSGPYDDDQLAWSPDGNWIAFSSNRSAEPDANENTDIFVVAPREGQVPRALTTSLRATRRRPGRPMVSGSRIVEGGSIRRTRSIRRTTWP